MTEEYDYKKNGLQNPQIAYHCGRKLDGGSFNFSKFGHGEGTSLLGPGLYFSTDRGIACGYSKYVSDPYEYEVEIDTTDIYNPSKGPEGQEHLSKAARELSARFDGQLKWASVLKHGRGIAGELVATFGHEKAREILVEAGIKGTYEPLYGFAEICVFDPSIIKIKGVKRFEYPSKIDEGLAQPSKEAMSEYNDLVEDYFGMLGFLFGRQERKEGGPRLEVEDKLALCYEALEKYCEDLYRKRDTSKSREEVVKKYEGFASRFIGNYDYVTSNKSFEYKGKQWKYSKGADNGIDINDVSENKPIKSKYEFYVEVPRFAENMIFLMGVITDDMGYEPKEILRHFQDIEKFHGEQMFLFTIRKASETIPLVSLGVTNYSEKGTDGWLDFSSLGVYTAIKPGESTPDRYESTMAHELTHALQLQSVISKDKGGSYGLPRKTNGNRVSDLVSGPEGKTIEYFLKDVEYYPWIITSLGAFADRIRDKDVDPEEAKLVIKDIVSNSEFFQKLKQLETGVYKREPLPKQKGGRRPQHPKQKPYTKAVREFYKAAMMIYLKLQENPNTKSWEMLGREMNEGVEDYGMSHRPSKTSPLHDLTEGGIIPEDIYTHPQYYADMSSVTYQQSMRAILKYKGKPDSVVTIYRASPRNMLNTGDWITLSKAYAQAEARAEDSPVHSFKVKVKDVWFAGDDVNEFGYWGPNIAEDTSWLFRQLTDEKKKIMKTGLMPERPVLNREFKKSEHFGKYGTSSKQMANAYYDFVTDVMTSDQLAEAALDIVEQELNLPDEPEEKVDEMKFEDFTFDPETFEQQIQELLDNIDHTSEAVQQAKFDYKNLVRDLKTVVHSDDDFHIGESILDHMKQVLINVIELTKDWPKKKQNIMRLTAFLHDIAKPETFAVNDQGKHTFYGHPDRGYEVSKAILDQFTEESEDLREYAAKLVKYHHHLTSLVHAKEELGDRDTLKYLKGFIKSGMAAEDTFNDLATFAKADSMTAQALAQSLKGIEVVSGDIDKYNAAEKEKAEKEEQLKAKERVLMQDKDRVSQLLRDNSALTGSEIERLASLGDRAALNKELGQRKEYGAIKAIQSYLATQALEETISLEVVLLENQTYKRPEVLSKDALDRMIEEELSSKI